MTKTIDHDPKERPRTDWREYRRRTLAAIHANHAQFEASPEGDDAKAATLRLAQALQPAFVVWAAGEFGQHGTDGAKAFKAMSRVLPWLFLHMGELIQGANGPYVMAKAVMQAVADELDYAIAQEEADDAAGDSGAGPATAGTA